MIILVIKEKGFTPILTCAGIVIIALITGIFFLFANRSNNTKNDQSDNQPKASFLLTFVRDGDVWISNIDGSNARQITHHNKIAYHWQHVASTKSQIMDVSNSYVRLPKVSFDGRYLAFESYTDESINQLAEREKRIATESAEIKSQGLSEIFDDPDLKYKLHIYDLWDNHEVNLQYDQNNSADYIGDGYSSVYWARARNTLVFVKHFNLHTVIIDPNQSDKQFTDTIAVKKFCGMNCRPDSDPLSGDLLQISPDGLKISAEYGTGEICGSSLEYKLYLIDLESPKTYHQPSSMAWCHISVGPWLDNDRFVNIEYQDGAGFYLYSKDDLNSRILLFTDNDYQYKGPVNISPDGRYISYPLGKYTYGSIGQIDLRIRNLQTQQYFDLLNLLQKVPGLSGDRTKYAKWDRNSKYLYLELENEKARESDLIRFDIDSKIPVLLIKNASQIDIN